MNKKEIYRIRKGKLIKGEDEIEIAFALVFETNGLISIEFYFDEAVDLTNLMKSIPGGVSYGGDHYLSASCETDTGMSLEFEGLDYKSIDPSRFFMEMICYRHVIHTENDLFSDLRSEDEAYTNLDPKLHYLVLEGLEMEYCSATNSQKKSFDRKIGKDNVTWDHTSCAWSCNFSLHDMDYYKDSESDNVIVEFGSQTTSIMTYEDFKELRHNYIALLSFLNGAPVKIRKECYGSYKTIGEPKAEKMKIYSFENKKNLRANQYIPLNNLANRSSNILNRVMIENFGKFSNWNQKIDLTSIIYYLNGAIQTKSLDEQFFILIIAFERLTTLYAELQSTQELLHPTKENYTPIKRKLFEILKEHKDDFGDYYDRAKSVIGGLNLVQRLSTKDKMYGILNDVGIPITENISSLIDVVRNEVVHKGEIGEGIDGYRNVFLLNDLLHEIILRLIEYTGPKNSVVLFR